MNLKALCGLGYNVGRLGLTTGLTTKMINVSIRHVYLAFILSIVSRAPIVISVLILVSIIASTAYGIEETLLCNRTAKLPRMRSFPQNRIHMCFFRFGSAYGIYTTSKQNI